MRGVSQLPFYLDEGSPGVHPLPEYSNEAINARVALGTDDPAVPLSSTHTGGVNVVFADGSVRFLRDSLDVNVLALLATRDDGLVASND
jgi:prepilin-type processing-associated H-X9-DG protein